jgi:hypothetical protein
MIKDIKEKYERFSDALILEIRYENLSDNRVVEVNMNCMNSKNDYEWETIKLIFNDILLFRFVENEKTSSTSIFAALLKEEDGIMVFDFFPLIYEELELKENENSDFIIKCRDVKYKVL